MPRGRAPSGTGAIELRCCGPIQVPSREWPVLKQPRAKFAAVGTSIIKVGAERPMSDGAVEDTCPQRCDSNEGSRSQPVSTCISVRRDAHTAGEHAAVSRAE